MLYHFTATLEGVEVDVATAVLREATELLHGATGGSRSSRRAERRGRRSSAVVR